MMTVSRIQRNERDECAIKLREFANRVSRGDVAYVAIYVMAWDGKVEEIIIKEDPFSQELSA